MKILDQEADFINSNDSKGYVFAITVEGWDTVEDIEYWPPSWENAEHRQIETWEEFWVERASDQARGGHLQNIELWFFS